MAYESFPITNIRSTSNASVNENDLDCEICQLSNKCRTSYPISNSQKNRAPFALIHSDVWYAPITSISSHQDFVSFIDNASRCIWIYVIKFHDELPSIF